MLTLYPPSWSPLTVELVPVPPGRGMVKPPPAGSYMVQVKVKGAVPPGLVAVRVPVVVEPEVQKMKTGSCLVVTG